MSTTPVWVPEPAAIEHLGIKKSPLRLMRNDGRLKPGVHWINITGTPNGPVSYDLKAIGETMAESNTKHAREKQGALCVAIHLPVKPHTHFSPSEMAVVCRKRRVGV